MLKISIVGSNSLTYQYINLLHDMNEIKINIVLNVDDNKKINNLTTSFKIHCTKDLDEFMKFDSDFILLFEDLNIKQFIYEKYPHSTILESRLLKILHQYFTSSTNYFNNMINNLQLVLNNIHDGLIVIDIDKNIQYMNEAAKKIIEIEGDPVNKPITKYIKSTRLPNVLRFQQKEVNQSYELDNGKKIITTRIPLINKEQKLIGAFAIFKDNDEVLKLAEENTDLKEVKTMLEAIIYSSDEAITVVDEKGLGLMINPAYTRITGLSESEIIGKHATVDISEGESIHMKVLKTRRPIRGAKMKVGPNKREVIVNVAPIIVNGILKGSIGIIHDISEIKQLTTELEKAKQIIRNLEANYTFADIVGNSSEMLIAIEQAKIGAKTPATVLLRGASGTGKELFAHAIHNASDRKHHAFIRVNCATISESIIESELFGYEEGAFTGAKVGGKIGLFEKANNGSIFLDEISELTLPMQAKLLRVLQEKEIIRVGGTNPIPLNIRVIVATNESLEKAIMSKEFREDLYYRLNRLPIYIPSLKERKSDIPELVNHMIAKINQLYGRNVTSISSLALEELQSYIWPGNVRELENIIGRAIIFMEPTETIIEINHLPTLNKNNNVVAETKQKDFKQVSLQHAMEEYEKGFISNVYKNNDFNKTKTAKKLDISVRNLYYKLEKYNLDK